MAIWKRVCGISTGFSISIALVACSASENGRADGEPRRRAAGEKQSDQHQREQDIRRAADNRLFTVAASPNGDAISEARKAGKERDFRFVGYSMLVPGIFPAAYGIECRPSVVSQGQRLVRAVFAASDVPNSREAAAVERALSGNFSRFGISYNKALLADPQYPYHDVCRAAPPGGIQAHPFEVASPHEYGFRNLQPTDRPIDLGEAARRGTLASLQSLIALDRKGVNKPDILGMTPLAWAIAYRRDDHAEALLREGASPAGADRLSAPTSPMQIARAMRWRSMIERMLRHVPTSRAERLEDPPQLMAKNRLALNAALSAAAKPYLPRLAPDGRTAHAAIISVAADGNARACRMEPSTMYRELDRALCRAILRSQHWEPAHDQFGEPVGGEASVPVRLQSDSSR